MVAIKREFCVVADEGAVGDGVHDDGPALLACLVAARAVGGTVRVPAGRYRVMWPVFLGTLVGPIAVAGDGSAVSVLEFQDSSGMLFSCIQVGVNQHAQVQITGIGIRANGECGTGLSIAYPLEPGQRISEHYRGGPVLRDVAVTSGEGPCFGRWRTGIRLQNCWNAKLAGVVVSGGAYGGNWNNLQGNGLELRGMLVNCHFSDLSVNFWAVGVDYDAEGGDNAEGMFFNNCSLVAVKRGVWLRGNGAIAAAPRMSTLTWWGGLVECRVGGVETGSAAFHLDRIWTAIIGGCQMITETLQCPTTTFGVIADNCNGVVVSACDINAFHEGIFLQGRSEANVASSCTFTNTLRHVTFAAGVRNSRSYGHAAQGGPVIQSAAEPSSLVGP